MTVAALQADHAALGKQRAPLRAGGPAAGAANLPREYASLTEMTQLVPASHGRFNLKHGFCALRLMCVIALCGVASRMLSRFLRQPLLLRDGVVMTEFAQSVTDTKNTRMRDSLMRTLFDHLSNVPKLPGLSRDTLR